jgi:hypothetical protein
LFFIVLRGCGGGCLVVEDAIDVGLGVPPDPCLSQHPEPLGAGHQGDQLSVGQLLYRGDDRLADGLDVAGQPVDRGEAAALAVGPQVQLGQHQPLHVGQLALASHPGGVHGITSRLLGC